MAQGLKVFDFDADGLLSIILLIIIVAALLGVVARMYVLWKGKKMAQGLQVFDADGNLDVDLADVPSKVLGTYTINTTKGSITVPMGKPWFIMIGTPEAYQSIWQHGDKEYIPTVYVSGNKICWEQCVNKGGVFYYGWY